MHSDQVLVKKQFEDSLALDICHTVMDHPDCELSFPVRELLI